MKKLIYLIPVFFTFLLSSTSFAEYIIKLKNGSSILTQKFWEERGEVKFYYANGVVGIPKKNVLSFVTLKEAPSERISLARERAPEMQEDQAVPTKVSEKSIEGLRQEAKKEEIDIEYYKKKKALYAEKFEEAYEKYLKASSKRDEVAKREAWKDFNHFGGRVIALEQELKKKNYGVIPEWWK